MNFFGSPEEHFHGRGYSGNTDLGETKRKTSKTNPYPTAEIQKLLVLVPRS